MRKRFTPGVVLGIIAVGFAMSGSAVAGSLITSAKIKDGTIRNKDIKKGTIALNRLTPRARRRRLRAPAARPGGGATGATGRRQRTARRRDDGAAGAAHGHDRARPRRTLEATAGNWGFINRNAIGAPTAFLRSGPADAPLGDGALNLTVRDGTEKVAYGNETDFVGDDFQPPSTPSASASTRRARTSARRRRGRRTCRGSSSRSTRTSTARRRELLVGGLHARQLGRPTPGARTSTPPRPASGACTGGAFAGTTCDINGARCTFARAAWTTSTTAATRRRS